METVGWECRVGFKNVGSDSSVLKLNALACFNTIISVQLPAQLHWLYGLVGLVSGAAGF